MVEMNLYYGLLLMAAILIISKRLIQPKKGHLKLPPSPLALPIIGHLHLLKQPLHQTLTSLADRYGPIILLRFGSRPVLIVSSPAAAEDCFSKNDAIFADRPLLQSFKHFGYNHTTLFAAPYGSHWRNLRRITTLQVFSTNRVTAVSGIRAEEVHFLLRQLFRDAGAGAGGGLRKAEMKPMFFELSFYISMNMIVGKRNLGEDDAAKGRRFMRIIEEVFSVTGGSNPEDFLPFLRWVGPSALKKKMISLEKELDEGAQEILDELKREKKRAALKEGEAKETMLDSMLSMQETEPQYYTDELIKGLIVTIIIGGADTSAETMEWAMSLLLNNPEVLKKARAEIDMHVGHDRLVTDADLANLNYLYNVIKETLRMFPAAPLLLPHQSTDECVVGGYRVPRGTMLLTNVYAVQRDPKVWTDPLEFRPERFEGGEVEGFRSFPFGVGRRRCPGEGLAKKLMGLALAALIQCFEWERVGKELVDLSEGQGLTIPKLKPLEAMYKPRQEMVNLLSQL